MNVFIYLLFINFFLRKNLESVWSQRFEFRSFNFAERNLKQFFIFLCFHSQGLIWTFPIDYWSISIDIFECDHVWIFKINGSLWTTELLIVQYLKLLNIYRGFESASEYKNLTLHNLFGNWNRFFRTECWFITVPRFGNVQKFQIFDDNWIIFRMFRYRWFTTVFLHNDGAAVGIFRKCSNKYVWLRKMRWNG